MRLQMTVRDLLVATWRVPAAGVARTLPAGLEPSLDEDGKALVSLVGLRNADVRAGGWRAPSFSQLGVRTYVTLAGAPAIFLLAIRVSLAGIGGVVFGMPLRPIRLRVRAGSVVAKGAGVLAQRIRRLALEHNIPIVEKKELARLLYKEVEINHPVPDKSYAAVAEVLAYVYQLKGKTIPGAA